MAATSGLGSAANVDLSSMTPREAADRLFLRVMRGAAAGDVAELQAFLPMALDAYELVDSLDSQGVFRVALLQRIAGMESEALTTLRAGLAEDPQHLLLLGHAAEIALSLGDSQAAREYAERFLDNLDEERERPLPEYQQNQAVIDNLAERSGVVLQALVAPVPAESRM